MSVSVLTLLIQARTLSLLVASLSQGRTSLYHDELEHARQCLLELILYLYGNKYFV